MKNSTTTIDTDKVRAYLLGDLRAEDMDEIEQAYFASEAALDDVAAAEQEMIEEYLEGRPSWAARFESRYLDTPAHRRRVEVIRELRSRARPGSRARIYFPLAVAAAVLIAAALGVVAIRRGLTAGSAAAGGRVAIALPAVAVRDGGETPTVHAGDAARIALLLEGTSGTTPPYRATVKTVEGREVWTGEAERATAEDTSAGSGGMGPIMATVTVPASALAADDYVLTLWKGDAELQRYYFRVARD